MGRAFTADEAGAGSGCIIVGVISVDEKPTKSDQPDADEENKTALADRKGQAKHRYRDNGTKYKIHIQEDQTNQ
ncbi:MAG TPA: hypothetical protein VJ733_00825 [Candidatus Binatia bacterium]|nr:hypothetical protein [Candidatus Binatia bacterium]